MTDARYPSRWLTDRRIARLSGDAHKLFVTTLAWSAESGTDGVIEPADLEMIPGLGRKPRTAELVDAGLWLPLPNGAWLSVVYEETQVTSQQRDREKSGARERKRRQRQREAGQQEMFGDDVTRDVTRDVTPMVTCDHLGQDRTGLNKERSASPNGAASVAGFLAFYDAYPRHVGRAAALKAWHKAIGRASPDAILSGARRLAADPNLPPKEYIPHPATWLNRDGWDDEPCPPRNGQNADAGEATGTFRQIEGPVWQ